MRTWSAWCPTTITMGRACEASVASITCASTGRSLSGNNNLCRPPPMRLELPAARIMAAVSAVYEVYDECINCFLRSFVWYNPAAHSLMPLCQTMALHREPWTGPPHADDESLPQCRRPFLTMSCGRQCQHG